MFNYGVIEGLWDYPLTDIRTYSADKSSSRNTSAC